MTMCAVIPSLAAIILAAVRYNSDAGTMCALNEGVLLNSDVDAEAVTFADNAATLKNLFIIQFVFLLPVNFCILFSGYIGLLLENVGKL